jgi:DNA-binding NarL/FixJ family response regulator
MTAPIRVLIVDDDVATRVGLRSIMAAAPDIAVVGESGSAEDAYELIPQLTPDVVLMDVQLPGADGITATERITARSPDTGPRVIVLTTFEIDDYVFRSLRAGASGFLLKRARAEDLTDAVRSVASGNALPAPTLTRRLIERFAVASTARATAVQTLTDREREVLLLIAGGRSNQEIGTDLGISPDTVKSHIKHVFTKLAVRDRSQAVIAAYESGLVVPGAVTSSTPRPVEPGLFH